MLSTETKERIQSLYRECIKTLALTPRYGQRLMIAEIAKTLASVSEDDEGQRDNDAGIAVVEAGTGTGKTLAYLLSALPIALEKEKKLIISTATVALQEQILDKDLPNLQKSVSLPFTYALAKGRGRYLCVSKLEKAMNTLGEPDEHRDMFNLSPKELERKLFQELMMSYGSGRWNGDRDRLENEIPVEQWNDLTATHRECSNRRCPHFNNCAFYKAREALEDADVIVSNHDLVLADLSLGGGVVLPPPAKSIYVFDEGHHLASKALGHFLYEAGIRGQRQWLQQLEKGIPSFVSDAGIPRTLAHPLAELPTQIQEVLNGIKLLTPLLSEMMSDTELLRFEQGLVPEALRQQLLVIKAPLSNIQLCLESLLGMLQKSLDPKADGEFTEEAATNWFAPVGLWLQRAEAFHETLIEFCAQESEESIPVARWIKRIDLGDVSEFIISASPISISGLLYKTLWSRCYGAVVTSATLTALNSFGKLMFESGIPQWANFQRMISPFDYPNLGELQIANITSEPNHPAFQQDVETWLQAQVNVSQATLVLFSSRRQLEETRDVLVQQWGEETLLCQGALPKAEIVKRHKARIDQGQGSVIFGLASFAEGIDLPGDYVSHVVIVKIPFAVPDDPILEATSEWMESRGRNPFMEISLAEASVRLVQACGRLIRTEQDRGRISILDKRLHTKRYGKMLIDALPPFKRV